MPKSSKWRHLPTEAINPNSVTLDQASSESILELMIVEDRRTVEAVAREKDRIVVAAQLIAESFRKGGRLVFVGAGTSGRLGILEAAEMGPTFGTPAGVIQAVMAGGRSAFFKSTEGVEDNFEEGSRAIGRLHLASKDVLLGISASGMTQFVRGAIVRARRMGLKIIFLTCWPESELQTFVDVIIAPAVGPEVIAGSTRLKAGTATKMVLNMLTTVVMVKSGKTYGNLMVDVQTGSEQRRDRAKNIITSVTGLDYQAAGELLQKAKWNVKLAIVMEKTGDSLAKAQKRLRRAKDSVRIAIGEVSPDGGRGNTTQP